MEINEVWICLEEEECYAKENFVPIIRPNSAKFLYDFVKNNNVKSVLEIGTAIGYSGSIMMSAGVSRLTTIDINEVTNKVAKNTFSKLGYLDKIEMMLEDAKIVLPRLVADNRKFDMVFLDGAKGQYINYLPNLLKLIDKDGIIFADNVLLGGMVESKEKIPHRKRTMVVNLRKYLEVTNSGDLITELVRIEDGIAITRYKGE